MIKMAFRNLIKNWRRSLLTLFSMSMGMTAVLFAKGYFNYSIWGLRESMIRGGIGHFQIYAKGYLKNKEDRPYDFLIKDYKKMIRKIYTIPGIESVAPRLKVQGLLASDEKSVIVMGYGGWSEPESKLHSFSDLVEGKMFDQKQSDAVLIGSGVAKRLRVKPGDGLTLMSAMKGGGINALDVEVSGIVRNQITEMDNLFILANLGTVQNLVFSGNEAGKLIVMLRHTEDIPKVEPLIQDFCKKNHLEYRRWDKLTNYYQSVKSMYTSIYQMMMIIILSIVIFSVTNSLFMNLYERVREIGTLRALGATRIRIAQNFLAESFLLALIGGLFGMMIGGVLALGINLSGGISVPPPPGNSRGYQAMIQPDLPSLLLFLLLLIAVSLLAALFPARRAAKMEIAECLRWI